jgi:putative protease
MDEILVGKVTHYFPRIEVGAVEVTGDELRVGDTIRVMGATSNFTQRIHSMEMDHAPVETATTGQLVAIQLAERARVKDLVFRIRAHPHN